MTLFARISRLASVVASVFILAASPLTYARTTVTKLGNGLEALYQDYLVTVGGPVAESVNRSQIADIAAGYRANAVTDATGRYRVTVYLTGDKPIEQVAAALAATRGFEVVSTYTRYRHGVIDGWVGIADAAKVAAVKGVSSVMLETLPVANIGSTTQQGVNRHRVDLIPGFDGTGITIGAMSDSYNTSTNAIKAPNDVASGDLPGALNPVGNLQDVVVIQDRAASSDEGRAMLQLIHDMAPKARLGFATAGTSPVQFAENILSLANRPGAPRSVPGFTADIIVDDIIFLTEPIFSDGLVAQAVNEVTANGTHYFSSAGNRQSSQGYAGTFNYVDPNGTPLAGTNINLTGVPAALYAGGFHNFRTDGGQDIAQTIRRTVGTANSSGIRVNMQWDDPFDVLQPGTPIGSPQSGNHPGGATTLDFSISLTAGVPSRVAVEADGSAFDAIVTILDPSNNVIVNAQDTDTDENVFFTPSVTGTYTVRVGSFASSTGAFLVSAFANSFRGVTTEYNLLYFRSDTGAFLGGIQSNAFAVNQPVAFLSNITFPTGQNSVQFVITRSQGGGANRLRYVLFDSSTQSARPDEYAGYQQPITYGHNSAANGHGVAAMSVFRPNIPESFTSPGPVTITHDAAGNRMEPPEFRQQPVIMGADGGNTTFFTSDSQGDADLTPNFFGTSAAAPTVASIAGLVLQAKGGPGTVSVAQMKNILINSAMPNDLDPNHSEAVIHVNGGTLTIAMEADHTNASSGLATAISPPQPVNDTKVFRVSYSGSGSVTSIVMDGTAGNTTGGNETAGVSPGIVWDKRPLSTTGSSSDMLPFIFGSGVGIVSGDVTPTYLGTPPAPANAANHSTQLSLALTAGKLTNGNSFTFNADRDELRISALPDGNFGPQIGNSADLFGAGTLVPDGTIAAGGVAVTVTMADGTTATGKFVNKLGRGYSPLSGYGFANAQRAVALAANVSSFMVMIQGSGSGTVTGSPSFSCTGNVCQGDSTVGASQSFTATPAPGSYFVGFTGCDSTGPTTCSIASLGLPTTVTATFVAITAPDSPIIGTATAGNGLVTVSFTAPAYDGGAAITSFTATCGAVSVIGPNSPIVVSPLPNGAAVTCTVTATNSAGTSPPSMPSNSVTPNAPVLAKGDFDGNGKGDLLFRNADGRGAIWLMDGLTTASSAEIFPAGTNWAVAQIADTNGDGKADLVWANPDGRIAVYLMDGTTTTSTANLLPAGGGWSVVGAGDLDGDGKSDIVFQNADGTTAAYLMNGTTVTSGATILGAGTGWSVTLVADFDGDGKKDLFFKHTDGRAAIYLMNGLTPTATVQILNAGTGWTATHAGDLNGDGKADIVWHNDDGRTAVWLMNGTTMSSGSEVLGAATGWAVTRVGDFDGDGKSDLVFEHTDGRVAIYLMNGTTPTATTQILNAGGGWTVKRVADMNGDGKADIIWENVDGSVAIWLMNGATMTSGSGVLPSGTGWAVSSVSQ